MLLWSLIHSGICHDRIHANVVLTEVIEYPSFPSLAHPVLIQYIRLSQISLVGPAI